MKHKKIPPSHIDGLTPMTFMDDPLIAERFIEMAGKVGQKEPDEFYEQQATYLKRIISESSDLRLCTVFSLYSAFIDVALDGMSLDRNLNLCYVQSSNVNVGTKDQPKWEKRAVRRISPYGELGMRIDFGQLKHANHVVVVYNCDDWAIETDDQANTIVRFRAKIPRATDARIIGSWVKLTRPDNTYDIYYMLEEDISRLRAFSEKQNKSSGANALYGKGDNDIDVGFLKAKTLKHAMKSMPKILLKGTSSEMDDDVDNFFDNSASENNVPSTPEPAQSWSSIPSNSQEEPPAKKEAPPAPKGIVQALDF